jgi:methionyl-tRNA formyltransferase
MKVIFMGTPDFACPTLEKLINDKSFEIAAVYTREPQIAGRGHKLTNSKIHDLALKHNLRVLTPKSLKNSEIQQEFKDLNADIAVVVAYGLILPKEILNGTKFGCINIHPSLLPKWRGAAPIQYSIMSGARETAVDIIKMDEGIDSGDIIIEEKIMLNGDETYLSLAPFLANKGAEVLIQALNKIRNNNFSLQKQDSSLATYAKKIEKSECKLDWNEEVEIIERKIRALSGSITAFFEYKGENIKVFASEIIDKNLVSAKIGEVLNDKYYIQCKKGILRPLILQRPGRKAVSIEEFLLGNN